jgi:streptogramin lyase
MRLSTRPAGKAGLRTGYLSLSALSRFGAAIFVVMLLAWSQPGSAQTVAEYPLPSANSAPTGITAGPDGALWFVETGANINKIGRITTAGAITEYPLSNPNGFVPGSTGSGITAGPDGALWFTELNKIGRITTTGAITEFSIPAGTGFGFPGRITVGSDGSLWFTELGPFVAIGRITTAGAVTQFTENHANGLQTGITAGPDGALWFTEDAKIARITTAGTITEYLVPHAAGSITSGPDGDLWFIDAAQNINAIGRITTAGAITEYPLPNANSFTPAPSLPQQMTAGPDGALWFIETGIGKIGRITTAGLVTEYPIPTANGAITAGPDGALWFTETRSGKIGRITVPTSTSTSLVAAILPSSRSVEVGATATAFATMINAGTSTATSCGITAVTSVPASFLYQTTNPETNALTGSPNTPTDIAAGASQSFVIAFVANAPFVPTVVDTGFACTNANAASSSSGLNTLLLSGSASPVPDNVALAATTSNDGILHITGNTGSAAFAVATVNVGATASITVTANSGSATPPLTITLCETVPSTGACMAAPSANVTTTINANDTPTFAIFGTASGAIPFDPANSRIFVQFSDSGGVVRGSTSVAVTNTQ